MNHLENDKKILDSIRKETKKLSEFIDKYSLEDIKGNAILQKAICFEILHLCRLYKKLGGRYAKRFGEFHDSLKEYASLIERDFASFDAPSLITSVKKELPLLLTRIEKILLSL